jgi:peptide/nickel transport system permease protein
VTSIFKLRLVVVLLIAIHGVIAFGGFFAPYQATTQNRDFPYAAPMRLHFVDPVSGWSWRPFVYRLKEVPGDLDEYQEDKTQRYPLQFFVRGGTYSVAGIFSFNLHLFGVQEPARVFLLGADGLGRDQFSRLLVGGQISLLAGILAALLSLLVGTAMGAAAGFFGKWADESVMRLTDLFLALPWLYLLLAVRAFLPLSITPVRAFLLIIAVIGFVGWARPARLVRGVVLSTRERRFVTAARGFGATPWYLLRRHILPQTGYVLLIQAAVLIPQYVLAEVTLSFVGLGVAEPVPSWGNMLANLQQYHVLVSYWWMYLPAVALVPVSLGYFLLADSIQDRAATTAL